VDSTGYGLYTVKLVIEGHHGRVWVESEGSGKGSQFYIELPAVE
jgi:signal transduction histidine kinase